MTKRFSVLAAFGVTLLASSFARAKVTEVGPADVATLEATINALAPGDELVLGGGTYELTDAWHLTVEGDAQKPIVIRAKTGEQPVLHRDGEAENLVDFDRTRFMVLRGIEFSGGSIGLRLRDVSDTTIEDCHIHSTGDVAIAANFPGTDYARLNIRHNHIHDTSGTGEGMYLGCNSDACRMHDSLIERNWVHNTNGGNVVQGDGIEIKEGSYANIVRDNVIHDTNYPCLITYSTVGNGGPNVLERNVMWRCGDHGIQSAADVVIRNNIILGAAQNGIANQVHQAGSPSNIVIVHNTIIAPVNDAIASTGITGSVLIANNAVYAQSGKAIRVAGTLGGVVVTGNVGIGGLDGVATGLTQGALATDFVGASFSGTVPNDVFPKAGGKLVAAGDVGHVVSDDFNGSARGGVADVGAYLFAASGNPAPALASGFKAPVTTVGPGADGGPGNDGSVPPGSADGGSGDGNGTGADAAADAGASGAPAQGDDGGCSCNTVANTPSASSAFGLALAGLVFTTWARRRRGRSTSSGRAQNGPRT